MTLDQPAQVSERAVQRGQSRTGSASPTRKRCTEGELRSAGGAPAEASDVSGGIPTVSSSYHRLWAMSSRAPGAALPFESTGWKTIWLDHLSFSVTNSKESASFYLNLLGWKST